MNHSETQFSLNYYGSTDIGLIRTENQDYLGKYPPDNLNIYSDKGQLFVVADGMGGHSGGKEASTTAVNTILDFYSRSYSKDIVQLVKDAITEANQKIYLKAQASTEEKKMGTTCVVLAVKENMAVAAHVGDSRIYKIEDDTIEQITVDHTQVQEMLNRGILTKSEAENYPSKSVLARALGVEQTVVADVKENIPLKNNQFFILCTDGLAKVNKEEILIIVRTNSIKEACIKLVQMANERGGKDNVTVQIIRINKENFSDQQPASKKRKKFPFFFLLLFIILLIAFYFYDNFNVPQTENDQVITDSSTILNDETKIQKYAQGSDAQLLERGDVLLKQGNLEPAAEIYKSILEKEPSHLAALNGINNVINVYITRAENLKGKHQYREALSIFLKVNDLRPGERKILDNILFCDNQLKFGNNKPDTLVNNDSLNIH